MLIAYLDYKLQYRFFFIKIVFKNSTAFTGHLKDKILTFPEQPIHTTVLDEFNEPGRTESSLRHLRQASQLLHIVENEQLCKPNTCYVELGAGKGTFFIIVLHCCKCTAIV